MTRKKYLSFGVLAAVIGMQLTQLPLVKADDDPIPSTRLELFKEAIEKIKELDYQSDRESYILQGLWYFKGEVKSYHDLRGYYESPLYHVVLDAIEKQIDLHGNQSSQLLQEKDQVENSIPSFRMDLSRACKQLGIPCIRYHVNLDAKYDAPVASHDGDAPVVVEAAELSGKTVRQFGRMNTLVKEKAELDYLINNAKLIVGNLNLKEPVSGDIEEIIFFAKKKFKALDAELEELIVISRKDDVKLNELLEKIEAVSYRCRVQNADGSVKVETVIDSNGSSFFHKEGPDAQHKDLLNRVGATLSIAKGNLQNMEIIWPEYHYRDGVIKVRGLHTAFLNWGNDTVGVEIPWLGAKVECVAQHPKPKSSEE